MDFSLLRGREYLHEFLACRPELVCELLDYADNDLFDVHEIPKKGRRGGSRTVWSIRDGGVADVYKGLSRCLYAFLKAALPGFPHDAAHGYVPGRSTLTNANPHVGARVLQRGDIRNFFGSVTRAHVLKVLKAAGLKEAGAAALADVVVRGGHLPLGLHTSPVLANAVFNDLDARLAGLVPGGTYTRYADDLSFSGPNLPSREAVARELVGHGFSLAEEKWRLAEHGRGLYVTGLSLEQGDRPRVPKHLKRRLRQDLYYIAKYGLSAHIGRRHYPSVQSGINKIDGTIRYLQGIERALGLALRNQWDEILGKQGGQVSHPAVGSSKSREVLFLLDESVVEVDDEKVMAVGLVVVEDPELVRVALLKFLEDQAADPYGLTPKEVLKKEGLHWNQLSQDDRSKATNCIRGLPFRSFVAFAPVTSEDKKTYDGVYRQLLEKVLDRRFLRYAGCQVHAVAEENSKVKGTSLGEVIKSSYQRLERAGSRRPASEPTHQIGAKGSDAALPLPDLLLGVFVDYARSRLNSKNEATQKKKQVSGGQAEKRFEQVRDKVRAIFDLKTGEVFSRRRPFEPWQLKV